jgi:hypothetical protein
MPADTVGKVRQAPTAGSSYCNVTIELQLTSAPLDHHLQGTFGLNRRQFSRERISRAQASVPSFHRQMP